MSDLLLDVSSRPGSVLLLLRDEEIAAQWDLVEQRFPALLSFYERTDPARLGFPFLTIEAAAAANRARVTVEGNPVRPSRELQVTAPVRVDDEDDNWQTTQMEAAELDPRSGIWRFSPEEVVTWRIVVRDGRGQPSVRVVRRPQDIAELTKLTLPVPLLDGAPLLLDGQGRPSREVEMGARFFVDLDEVMTPDQKRDALDSRRERDFRSEITVVSEQQMMRREHLGPYRDPVGRLRPGERGKPDPEEGRSR